MLLKLKNSTIVLQAENKAYAESYLQNLNTEDDFALQYAAKNGIDLTNYYTPKSESHTTQAEAILSRPPADNIPRHLTLSELYEDFIHDRKTNNIAAKTVKAYKQQISLLGFN